jgi:predicted transposase/invertase (TIGR01784 family)
MERFNPLNDYLFLKIMGEPGDEVQCRGFLNAVLADSQEKPLRLVKILENRSLSAESLGDKASILDVRALAETDTEPTIKVNVEVQLKDLHNMTERTLYYWAKEYTAGIKEGEDYRELPRVLTINIVRFDHVKVDRVHTVFRLREDTDREYLLTEALAIHFVNMVKFRGKREKDSRNNLERWLMFFDERTGREVLEEIMGIDPAIAQAQRRLEEVTRDEEFRHNYLVRQLALSDWTTGINTAFERGVKEGREKGIKEGREKGIKEGRGKGIEEGILSVARNALAKGLSVDTVQQITGLDTETICALPKE